MFDNESLYVPAQIHQCLPGAVCLIDTGAEVSALNKLSYDQIPEAERKPLRTVCQPLTSATGEEMRVYGVVDMVVTFPNVRVTHEFWVCDMPEHVVLGVDFLKRHQINLDVRRRQLEVGGVAISLCTSTGRRLRRDVKSLYTVHIPPNEERMVLVAIYKGRPGEYANGAQFEPFQDLPSKRGITTEPAAVTVDGSIFPVRVCNPGKAPVKVRIGMPLGEVYELPEPVREDLCRQPDTSEYPAHVTGDFAGTCDLAGACDFAGTCDLTGDRGLTGDSNTTSASASTGTGVMPAVVCRDTRESLQVACMQYDDSGSSADLGGTELRVDSTSNAREVSDSMSQPPIPEHLTTLYEDSVAQVEPKHHYRIAKLMVDHADVFAKNSTDLGRTTWVKHHIDTGAAPPIREMGRRHSLVAREEMARQVLELRDKGIVKPSTGEWASNVVLVKKKDGSWRMCIDYRRLNEITLNDDPYMLPRIDETLDRLGGTRWFATLDLIMGYHQVELTESSKIKTAFVVPGMTPPYWQFEFMPFGLKGAPHTFQRLIDKLMYELPHNIAMAYLDDIIVYSRSVEEKIERLRLMFEQLRAAGLKLKPKKCELFKERTGFLGHIVSSEGVHTDPAKVEAADEWMLCRTPRQIKSFLGLVGYYRRFIPDFAEIACPMYDAEQPGTKFRWTGECQLALQTLQDRLRIAPVLAYPQAEGLYILETDARDRSVSGTLAQVQTDHHGDTAARVIFYGSKRMQQRELNYCVRRRELLAMVTFVKYFRTYLWGREVLLKTPHAGLQYIRTLREPTEQMNRWMGTLENTLKKYTIQITVGPEDGDQSTFVRCGKKVCICEGVHDLDLALRNRRVNQCLPPPRTEVTTMSEDEDTLSDASDEEFPHPIDVQLPVTEKEQSTMVLSLNSCTVSELACHGFAMQEYTSSYEDSDEDDLPEEYVSSERGACKEVSGVIPSSHRVIISSSGLLGVDTAHSRSLPPYSPWPTTAETYDRGWARPFESVSDACTVSVLPKFLVSAQEQVSRHNRTERHRQDSPLIHGCSRWVGKPTLMSSSTLFQRPVAPLQSDTTAVTRHVSVAVPVSTQRHVTVAVPVSAQRHVSVAAPVSFQKHVSVAALVSESGHVSTPVTATTPVTDTTPMLTPVSIVNALPVKLQQSMKGVEQGCANPDPVSLDDTAIAAEAKAWDTYWKEYGIHQLSERVPPVELEWSTAHQEVWKSFLALMSNRRGNDTGCKSPVLDKVGEQHLHLNAVRVQRIWTPAMLREAQLADPDISPILLAKEANETRPSTEIMRGYTQAAKVYCYEWEQMEVHHGVLHRKWQSDDGKIVRFQIVLPFELRDIVLEQLHDAPTAGHLGQKKTRYRVQIRYYWFRMRETIDRWIQTCDACQKRKRPQKTPKSGMTMQPCGGIFQRIAMDICGKVRATPDGNLYVLVVADYFSKYTMLFPLKDKESQTVLHVFATHWIPLWGCPEILHTDRGGEFTSKMMTEFCERFNIRKTQTTAHNPRSDGMVERLNHTVMQIVNTITSHFDEWDVALPFAQMAYNSTVHATTGETPNMVVQCRHIRMPIDVMTGFDEEFDDTAQDAYVRQVESDMRDINLRVRDHAGRAMRAQKYYHDRKIHAHDYHEDDLVYVKRMRYLPLTRKITDRYEGPYVILHRLSGNCYRIVKRGEPVRTVTHDKLKPAYARSETDVNLDWVRPIRERYQRHWRECRVPPVPVEPAADPELMVKINARDTGRAASVVNDDSEVQQLTDDFEVLTCTHGFTPVGISPVNDTVDRIVEVPTSRKNTGFELHEHSELRPDLNADGQTEVTRLTVNTPESTLALGVRTTPFNRVRQPRKVTINIARRGRGRPKGSKNKKKVKRVQRRREDEVTTDIEALKKVQVKFSVPLTPNDVKPRYRIVKKTRKTACVDTSPLTRTHAITENEAEDTGDAQDTGGWVDTSDWLDTSDTVDTAPSAASHDQSLDTSSSVHSSATTNECSHKDNCMSGRAQPPRVHKQKRKRNDWRLIDLPDITEESDVETGVEEPRAQHRYKLRSRPSKQ